MRRDGRRQDPAVAGFVARLGHLHAACGAPSYRSLVKTSKRLGVLYPEYVQGRTLPTLSVTALSEVLRGQRSSLPTPGWVNVFVLSCQRRAYETGVHIDDLGPDTLAGWVTAWRAAQAAAKASNAPTSDAPGMPQQGRPR